MFVNFSRPPPSAEAVCFKNSEEFFLELLKESNWNTNGIIQEFIKNSAAVYFSYKIPAGEVDV